jgi:hypothetical protein
VGHQHFIPAGLFGLQGWFAHGGDDIPTVAGKEPYGGLADTGGTTGDENGFVHDFPLLAGTVSNFLCFNPLAV